MKSEHSATEPQWTPRQREVLGLLARGCTNGQIAEQLGITLHGAKWHVSEIITKLGVDSREEAAAYGRSYNGMRRRLTRAFRSLLPGAALLKFGAAGATIAAAAIAGVIVVVALQSSGTPQDAARTQQPANGGQASISAELSCGAPAPTETADVWAQVAGALGDAKSVLRPPAPPLRLTGPRLTWVCTESNVPQYTVVYGTPSESLFLCLDRCYGINFPGPPTSASASLRGVTASEMTTKNVNGSAPSAFEISWTEGGRRYIAKLTSAHLQMSDLETVVESLAPMP